MTEAEKVVPSLGLTTGVKVLMKAGLMSGSLSVE